MASTSTTSSQSRGKAQPAATETPLVSNVGGSQVDVSTEKTTKMKRTMSFGFLKKVGKDEASVENGVEATEIPEANGSGSDTGRKGKRSFKESVAQTFSKYKSKQKESGETTENFFEKIKRTVATKNSASTTHPLPPRQVRIPVASDQMAKLRACSDEQFQEFQARLQQHIDSYFQSEASEPKRTPVVPKKPTIKPQIQKIEEPTESFQNQTPQSPSQTAGEKPRRSSPIEIPYQKQPQNILKEVVVGSPGSSVVMKLAEPKLTAKKANDPCKKNGDIDSYFQTFLPNYSNLLNKATPEAVPTSESSWMRKLQEMKTSQKQRPHLSEQDGKGSQSTNSKEALDQKNSHLKKKKEFEEELEDIRSFIQSDEGIPGSQDLVARLRFRSNIGKKNGDVEKDLVADDEDELVDIVQELNEALEEFEEKKELSAKECEELRRALSEEFEEIHTKKLKIKDTEENSKDEFDNWEFVEKDEIKDETLFIAPSTSYKVPIWDVSGISGWRHIGFVEEMEQAQKKDDE